MFYFGQKLNLALCEGRHEIKEATDGSLFPSVIENVTDLTELETIAFKSLWKAAYKHYQNHEVGYLYETEGTEVEELQICNNLPINIYVTGLTVALIAALNVCRDENLKVTLYHYDRESGEYFPQEVR